jgi:hypothetical protein
VKLVPLGRADEVDIAFAMHFTTGVLISQDVSAREPSNAFSGRRGTSSFAVREPITDGGE